MLPEKNSKEIFKNFAVFFILCVDKIKIYGIIIITVMITVIEIKKGGLKDFMVLKKSKQRDAIKAYLMSRKDHPTADQIYTELREEHPNLSLGTVYRNLTLLESIGEIQRFQCGTNSDRFDGNASNHYHFICDKCGSVHDIPLDMQKSLQELAQKHFDGQIDYYLTYFHGRCADCTKEV